MDQNKQIKKTTTLCTSTMETHDRLTQDDRSPSEAKQKYIEVAKQFKKGLDQDRDNMFSK